MTYWPKDSKGNPFVGAIRLHEEYDTTTHDYIDVPELFDPVVKWIKQRESRNIVCAGCGNAPILGYLKDYAHRFMGFDTAPALIDQAKSRYPNAEFVNASWNNEEAIRTYWPVDCLLLMGVLAYGLPEYGFHDKNGSPEQIFDRLVRLYNPKHVIIRETRADQQYVDPGNQLHVVDLSYFRQFPHEEIHVDVNMWIGNKVLLNVTC